MSGIGNAQVLVFHRVKSKERIFSLANVRTGSIRDQLIRSTLLIHALVDDGYFNPVQSADKKEDNFELLIFGAGVAGINAALIAAARGINVKVIDGAPSQFETIRYSKRAIDPVEYDWPHAHFDGGTFPMSSFALPLQYKSGPADVIVSTWDDMLLDLKNTNSEVLKRITFIQDTEASNFIFEEIPAQYNNGKFTTICVNAKTTTPVGANAKNQSRIICDWLEGRSKSAFGAVLWCIGFGIERSSLAETNSPYQSPPFWGNHDPIPPRENNWSQSSPLEFSSAVISGGGDGAMQDMQRVLTGTFGKSLLNIFESALQKAGHQHGLPEAMLRKFIQAEDIGRRAYVWHSHFAENSSAAYRWHKVYAVEVNKFIAMLSDTQKLSLQQDLFRPELTAGKLILYWLVREECPGYSYALNRFLTLVLIALAPNNSVHFFPFAKITKIEVDSRQAYHTCGSHQNCTGIPHDVHVECPDNSLSPILSAIDLILLRHGATWENSIISKKLGSVLGVLPSAPEQMVAYDLPERP